MTTPKEAPMSAVPGDLAGKQPANRRTQTRPPSYRDRPSYPPPQNGGAGLRDLRRIAALVIVAPGALALLLLILTALAG